MATVDQTDERTDAEHVDEPLTLTGGIWDALTAFRSDETRLNLDCIHVTPRWLEVSDASILVRYHLQEGEAPPGEDSGVYLPHNGPNKRDTFHLEVVEQEEDDRLDLHADDDTTYHCHAPEGREGYPDSAVVYSDLAKHEEQATVCLSAENLRRLADLVDRESMDTCADRVAAVELTVKTPAGAKPGSRAALGMVAWRAVHVDREIEGVIAPVMKEE